MIKKTYAAFYVGLVVLGSTFSASAQTKVRDNSISGTSIFPNVNAVMELESSTKGLLLPRVQLTAINSFAPLSNWEEGMTVYNTATAGAAPNSVTPGTYYCDGNQWIRMPWKIPHVADTDSVPNPANGDIIFNTRIQGFQFYDSVSGWWQSIALPVMTTVQRDSIDNPYIGQTIYNANERCINVWSGAAWLGMCSIPQMSSAERDDIVSPPNGYLIYNTDEDCFNYYSNLSASWLSLCGTPQQAQASIASCGNVKAMGNYIAGTPLTNSNYLSIPVVVSSNGGTYTVMATTQNGYYYSASGAFPAAGSYVINIPGAGTPVTANATGDPVTISINGAQQSCQPLVVVLPATPSYSITAITVNPSTPYIPGQAVTSSNFLSVMLTVQVPGQWSLLSGTVDGFSFHGQGDMATASGYNPNGTFPQVITVTVPATGTPQLPGGKNDNFTLATTNSAVPSSMNFIVQTAAVAYAVNCANATINGSFATSIPLTGTETITVPVTVTVPGTSTLTATGGGISFTSGAVTFGNTGDTTLVLTPTGTNAPTVGGNQAFSLSGNGLTSTCTIPVTISTPAAQLTLTGMNYLTATGTASTTGGRYVIAHSINPNDATPDQPQQIQLMVNVTTPGTYSLTAGPLNGITYTASGIFTNTGANSLILAPSGTPGTIGTQNYAISGNGINTTVPIYFAYRKFNIVSFVSSSSYGFYSNPVALAITNGTGTFGPGGVIPCEASPSVINSTTDLGGAGAANATALANALNSNKADILYISYSRFEQSTANTAVINVIKDFVFNKHGILIFAQEYAGGANGYATQLVNAMFNTTLTAPVNATVGLTYDGMFTGPASSPIINGPFPGGSLAGLMQTVTSGNAGWMPMSNTIPSDMTVLSNIAAGNASAYVGQILSVQNTRMGVYMSFDNTFNSATMPANSVNTAGVPNMPTANSTIASSNSMLFANLFAWALQYGAYNINTSYQVAPGNTATYPGTFVPATPTNH